MRTHFFAQALLFSTLSSCLNAQRCYLPNGDWDGGSEDSAQPCNTEAEFSHCCGTEAICLSNGYCYDPSSVSIYRSSCTDKTWQSTACPTYCNDGMSLPPLHNPWVFTTTLVTDPLISRYGYGPRALSCAERLLLLRHCHQLQLLQYGDPE